MPDTNNIDLDCPLGVSAFSDAIGFIRDADEQWERILWELESSERAIDASEDLFRFNPETNQPVLPKGRERMYHCLEATGEGGKTIYNTFSPEVRDNSYFHALNQIFRQIENTTGLSYGTISEVSDVEKTAEEVKISKQCSFVRVCDIQKNLQTALEQLAAAVSLQQAEDAGCYLMEITAHSGARPDHAKWQGQLVMITGKDAGKIIDGLRVFTLSEIGYGSGEGFKGWNCRHNWHAYYPGLSTPNYTQEELKKLDEPCISYNGKLYTEYEVSQMQRAQERRVRAWKRRCITAQEGVNSATDEATNAAAQAEYSKSAVHLKANEEKLKDFCKQTGQNRDRFREQVYRFGRSEAQRAVQANNSSFRNTMRQKGIKNPPKSLAEFQKMKYNNPKEYDLMQSYSKSVDSGMMSPLVGYKKYKEYHKRVEKELVGLTTSNGIEIKSQSNHFLERVFGTISDPTHEGAKRSGVELENIAEALKNGSVRQHKNGSYIYKSHNCEVSLNPNTGNLIQVTPKKRNVP